MIRYWSECSSRIHLQRRNDDLDSICTMRITESFQMMNDIHWFDGFEFKALPVTEWSQESCIRCCGWTTSLALPASLNILEHMDSSMDQSNKMDLSWSRSIHWCWAASISMTSRLPLMMDSWIMIVELPIDLMDGFIARSWPHFNSGLKNGMADPSLDMTASMSFTTCPIIDKVWLQYFHDKLDTLVLLKHLKVQFVFSIKGMAL